MTRMPVTSAAVLLPSGNRVIVQPDAENKMVNILGCVHEPVITLTREESRGIKDLLNILYPET